jgi:hypothetical protein
MDLDGGQIVQDGERGQEHAQGRGQPAAKSPQHGERESDVRRHRDRPALPCPRVTRVHRDIDRGRQDHAAQGRDSRCGQLLPCGQMSGCYFPTYFQPDEKKEQ